MNYKVGDFIKEVVSYKIIWYSIITCVNRNNCNALVFSGPNSINDYIGRTVIYSNNYYSYNTENKYIEIITKESNSKELEFCEKQLNNYYKRKVFE